MSLKLNFQVYVHNEALIQGHNVERATPGCEGG